MGMKGSQRYRRVLFSRWGVLSLVSFILLSYLYSFIEVPSHYEVKRDNPLPLIMFALVITIPLVIWVFGLGKIDEEDARRFLEENPHLKKELTEGESLIDFLYEDEDEGSR
jgi:hypothetical protein